MKLLSLLLLTAFLNNTPTWETDFSKAQQKAQAEHKYLLLNFSGSDWCIPCIKMHKEVFDSPVFSAFADSSLVLVNADFPRLKKHALPKEQQKKNDALADKFDPQGSFPFTVLLNEQGKVVRSWEGYPDLGAEQFTSQLKTAINAGH